ncbi:MAG: signal peptidase II [Clostridia bacterium]
MKAWGFVLLGAVVAALSDGIAILAVRQRWSGVVYNPGIGFGLLKGSPAWALGLGVAGLVAAGFLVAAFARGRMGTTLVLAGGLANLMMRVALGHVVDYWHIRQYPYTFNLADVAIRLGALWFIGAILLGGRAGWRLPRPQNDEPPGRAGPPGGVSDET